MPPYGEPDWAMPGNTANTATEQTPGITAAPDALPPTTGSTSGQSNGKCQIVMLSVLNIGLCAMMGALGMIALVQLAGTSFDLTDAFLSFYMVIFATLLFLYEFIWWQPVKSLNIMFRKNFGFLYGLKGKGLYMIFIAFLTLGMLQDDYNSSIKGLDWATGVGWLTSGVLHLFVSCSTPGANDLYRPPSVGLNEIGAELETGDNNI